MNNITKSAYFLKTIQDAAQAGTALPERFKNELAHASSSDLNWAIFYALIELPAEKDSGYWNAIWLSRTLLRRPLGAIFLKNRNARINESKEEDFFSDVLIILQARIPGYDKNKGSFLRYILPYIEQAGYKYNKDASVYMLKKYNIRIFPLEKSLPSDSDSSFPSTGYPNYCSSTSSPEELLERRAEAQRERIYTAAVINDCFSADSSFKGIESNAQFVNGALWHKYLGGFDLLGDLFLDKLTAAMPTKYQTLSEDISCYSSSSPCSFDKISSKSTDTCETDLSTFNARISAFRSEHPDMQPKDIALQVIKIGSKKQHSQNSAILIHTLRTVIEIYGLDAPTYDQRYSTYTNKTMHIDRLIQKILSFADTDCKKECALQPKRILLKMVYPEYYQSQYKAVTPSETFFVSGEAKAVLSRAAKCSISHDKCQSKISDGAIVDTLIMNAISNAFANINIFDTVQIMNILASREKIRSTFRYSSGGSALPGCFSVIDRRNCYRSYLDFYFLNLQAAEQQMLADDHMRIRLQAQLAPIPLLDMAYQIFKENR